MPLLGSTSNLPKALGLFSSLGDKYWLALFGSNQIFNNSITVGSDKHLYIQSFDNSLDDNIMLSVTSDGTERWQKSLAITSARAPSSQIVADSSNNNYYAGQVNVSGDISLYIGKRNQSGTLQWQKKLTDGTNDSIGASYLAIDDSNYLYVCGWVSNAPSYSTIIGLVTKYDDAGAVQFQKTYWNNSNSNNWVDIYGIATYGTDDIYPIAYYYNADTGIEYCCLFNLDNTGAIQWQKNYYPATGYVSPTAIATDSNNNIYFSGLTFSGSLQLTQIVKYNSSGTVQWEKLLENGSDNVSSFAGMCVDGNNNVYYVVNTNPSGGDSKAAILKYNSSGTLQWQRHFKITSKSVFGFSVYVDGNILYFVGQIDLNYGFIAKLPVDGSKTGTYTVGSYSITYEASSITETTTSNTSANSDLSATSTSYTHTNSSLTDGTTSLTLTVAQI